MTVRELQARLDAFPGDLEVAVFHGEHPDCVLEEHPLPDVEEWVRYRNDRTNRVELALAGTVNEKAITDRKKLVVIR